MKQNKKSLSGTASTQVVNYVILKILYSKKINNQKVPRVHYSNFIFLKIGLVSYHKKEDNE